MREGHQSDSQKKMLISKSSEDEELIRIIEEAQIKIIEKLKRLKEIS